mgnify:CR=1 FL=1
MAVTPTGPDRWRRTVRSRVLVMASVMALWGVAIEARLVHLQVFRYDALMEQAERQQSRSVKTVPKRGEIVDRNGRLLAYSVEADTVVAVPNEVDDAVGTTDALCQVLDCSEGDWDTIETRLSRDGLFAYVERHVSVQAAHRIRELDLPGIGLIKENRRFYPNSELGAHLLGYVGVDNEGLHGLESLYDEEISGREGVVLVQTDAHGRAFSRVERPPMTGVSLELTIDKYIQHIAERELRAAVREHDAEGGSVVVMDPATGEILALANEPTFNPNVFASTSDDQRRNRATQAVYEPGSIFKVITASAALEEGVSDPTEEFDTNPGVIRFGSRTISDLRNYGVLSFADVLVRSSNVGASQLSQRLGTERMGRYVRRFGFGERASSDFPGESRGIVHDPARLTESDLASVSMGYSISVTPLQMAAAMSAVANGGELVALRLVRAVLNEGERVESPRRIVRRVMSENTALTMTRILEDVVSRGTARRAQLVGYTAAGKTGTTEKLIDGRYDDNGRNIASFAGFTPSTRPELTILVVVDDVSRGGGTVAAPVFQRIAEAALRQLGVPPNIDAPAPVLVADDPFPPVTAQPVAARTQAEVRTTGIGTAPGTMPDLRGLGARQALEVATELGLSVEMNGDGFVVGQSPAPGAVMNSGQLARLELDRRGLESSP